MQSNNQIKRSFNFLWRIIMNNLITKSCILVAIFLSANAGYSADNLDDLVESCEKNAKNKYTIHIDYGHANKLAIFKEERLLEHDKKQTLSIERNMAHQTLTMSGSNGYEEKEAIEKLKFLDDILLQNQKFMDLINPEHHEKDSKH